MSDKRRRDHSILLRVGGERYSVEFIDARKWDHPLAHDGLYRIKINGKFIGRDGEQFSFITMREGVERALALLEGNPIFDAAPVVAEPPRPRIPLNADVYADYGPEFEDVPLYRSRGVVKTTPHQEIDRLWYVWVYIDGVGMRKVRCDDIKSIRRR